MIWIITLWNSTKSHVCNRPVGNFKESLLNFYLHTITPFLFSFFQLFAISVASLSLSVWLLHPLYFILIAFLLIQMIHLISLFSYPKVGDFSTTTAQDILLDISDTISVSHIPPEKWINNKHVPDEFWDIFM